MTEFKVPLIPRQVERFWQKVDRSGGTDACWPWLAFVNEDGYGQMQIGNRSGRYQSLRAHQMAYLLIVGPYPDGLTLDHTCRQPRCCNPAHLEPVTKSTNVQRSIPFRIVVLGPIAHGTEKGYAAHRRRSELPCTPCRGGHAEYVRNRRLVS